MTTARYRPTWELAVDPLVSCKLCLGEFPLEQMTTITQCQCVFCTLVSRTLCIQQQVSWSCQQHDDLKHGIFTALKSVTATRSIYKCHISCLCNTGPCVKRSGQRNSNTHLLSDLNKCSPQMRKQCHEMNTKNRNYFLEHSLGCDSDYQSSASRVYCRGHNVNTKMDSCLTHLIFKMF